VVERARQLARELVEHVPGSESDKIELLRELELERRREVLVSGREVGHERAPEHALTIARTERREEARRMLGALGRDVRADELLKRGRECLVRRLLPEAEPFAADLVHEELCAAQELRAPIADLHAVHRAHGREHVRGGGVVAEHRPEGTPERLVLGLRRVVLEARARIEQKLAKELEERCLHDLSGLIVDAVARVVVEDDAFHPRRFRPHGLGCKLC
jgi:hypothetical protein